MARQAFQWWVPVAALAALGAMEAWKSTLPDAGSGKPFLAHIKDSFENYPTIRGPWEGTAGELPKEAMAMLHPNFYLDRQYVNVETHESVGMFLIEAEDTRDMMGHYPPNCYPGNGWVLVKQELSSNNQNDKAEWIVGDLHIRGMEYEFKQEVENREKRLWVRNFFVLPNGKFYPDMPSFGRAASDFYVRPYGATQVQILYDREYLPEDRERIFQSLIMAHMDLIKAVTEINFTTKKD